MTFSVPRIRYTRPAETRQSVNAPPIVTLRATRPATLLRSGGRRCPVPRASTISSVNRFCRELGLTRHDHELEGDLMNPQTFDVIVIAAGPAGEVLAGRPAVKGH